MRRIVLLPDPLGPNKADQSAPSELQSLLVNSEEFLFTVFSGWETFGDIFYNYAHITAKR